MKIIALVTAAALSWTPASPQASQQAAPKIEASAELVLVPVVVRKSGAHVAGMTKQSFTLLQDGKPQPVAVFEEVHAAAPSVAPEHPPQEFTNTRASQNAERMTIIALDLVNTAPLDQAYMKQEMLKFLDNAGRTGEPFALIAITSGGLHMLQTFTTDRKAIAAGIRQSSHSSIGRENPGSTGSALDQTPCALSGAGCGGSGNSDRAMGQLKAWEDLYKNEEEAETFRDRSARLDTLSALQQIAQWLGGFPGRKSLVWAGSGIQWSGGMMRMMGVGMGSGSMGDYSRLDTTYNSEAVDANMYTFKLLSAANVAVYPLDARHGANTSYAMYDTSRSDAPIGDRGFAAQKGKVQDDDQQRITMFEQIAASTGGKPCFNRTDLSNCLDEFAVDSHDYYLLGFYADKQTKVGWHKLTVKADRSAELRYRNGFMFAPADPEKSRMNDLQLAAVSPLPYTTVQLSGRFAEVENKEGKRIVHFILYLPPDLAGQSEAEPTLNFDVVAIARGADGKEAAKFGQRVSRKLQPQQAEVIRRDGIRYSNKLEVPAGTYGVWFVVRDNVTGRTGSVVSTIAAK
jgi:VWFA-related protein